MLDNKAIYAIVKDVCGDGAAEVVKALRNRKNFSEFKLAEKLDKNVNETRNLLYILSHANLVSEIRRKDKKKGWYIYYWTFHPKAVKQLFLTKLKKDKVKIKNRLEKEQGGSFFMCDNKCVRADFDQAAGFEFKCPECGEIVNPEDNAEKTKKLESDLKSIEKRIKSLS